MGEFLSYAIFGSFVWFCIILGVFLISCFAAENYKQGYIAFTGLVAFMIINYFWGNINLMHFVTWQNILVYFGIGFLYAAIRCYFYGRKIAVRYKDNEYSLSIQIKGHVFRWWFMWPISLISWAVSDLLENAWDFIYDKFSNSFRYFFELGLKSKKKV